MRRITLVIHSLAMGGAERVVAAMANHWAAEGHSITLITLDSQQHDSYPLIPQVERVGLGLMSDSASLWQALASNKRRIAHLRDAIRRSRPDAVISATDKMNVVTLLACRGLDVPVIIAEHTDPRHHRLGPIWSGLRRLTYPQCTALVVLTESVRGFSRRFVRRRPIYVIPNAVDPGLLAAADQLSEEPASGQRPRLVAMGRLAPVKGFDRLISAFAQIAARHPEWKLWILGEGPLREELQRMIDARQLRSRVSLRGWTSSPVSILKHSDLFVLSSRYEGFPNSLLEAMACGLPVISFNCESGPAEIIRHEIDGILVPPDDIEALAAAMDRLMSAPNERAALGARAVEVRQRFSVEEFFGRWNAVLRGEAPQ